MSYPRPLRVRVAEVIAETPDACSLVLEPEPGDAGRFAYRPGQFLTVRIPEAGGGPGSVARCYSLASSPVIGEQPRITVKRTRGGHGSNWICDTVKEGCTLEVLRPAGTFTPATLDTDFVLFAAGSGITPVMSILKSALHAGSGTVTLFYANRDESSVIFRDELIALARAYPLRLHVVHWLESVQGLPTAAGLRQLAAPRAEAEAFVCGPGPFMDTVVEVLTGLGTPPGRVHVERFSSSAGDPFAEPESAGDPAPTGTAAPAGSVEVRLDGETRTVPLPAGTKLLDALLAAGLDAPFSCREGSCSACACRLLSGEVTMEHNEVLEQADLDEGYILACQSTALTEQLRVSYDAE
ncbi:2Fe-2S iron-sulfur cluster-binding protein [Streptomyces sp. NBC_01089]|uniref:2Fe-2S iron-sulfur cluster-binding protein n=1 Tax=Streptomyces sp. NBC_01089 TaxID=2903747 RepID=UPI003865F39F|nr:ferredoxin--NADP reductase [Streptomyces sp. NBC_01089]